MNSSFSYFWEKLVTVVHKMILKNISSVACNEEISNKNFWLALLVLLYNRLCPGL